MTVKQRTNSEKKRRGPGRPWSKGESGNPKGRPPSKRYLSEALREWLAQPSDADAEMTNADALAAAVGKYALSDKPGAIQAAALIADRVEGKAKAHVSVSDERGKSAMESIIAGLVATGLSEDDARKYLAGFVPEVEQWIN